MEIEEGRITFDFPESSKAIKFDDTDYYRKVFNTLPGAKGVDFISIDKYHVAFIEIKNCLGDEGNCRWRIFPNNQKKETSHTTVDVEGRDSLDIEVAEKMAMTLAALSGVLSMSSSKESVEELKTFANRVDGYLKDETKKKFVILFLEGNFGGHTRTKKMIMSELQKSLNAKLKWLNCKVSVVDSSTYEPGIFQIV
jgi:hypothetical protein